MSGAQGLAGPPAGVRLSSWVLAGATRTPEGPRTASLKRRPAGMSKSYKVSYLCS
jgi:hypothetical protein